MPVCRALQRCRSCGSDGLEEVLDLGEHCLSSFLEPGEALPPKAPLVMVRCGNCTLVQLAHTVDRERLFRRYWYHSGGNETMVAALRDVVEEALRRIKVDSATHALDIGCNDGTLLGCYPGWMQPNHLIGIDPSSTLGTANGMFLGREGFFPDVYTDDDFRWMQPGFKVITSIACFYASDDPNAFVAAIKRILHREGVWVVQLQDLESVVWDRAFDYVCHEHLTLWEPVSFDRLLGRHGLEIQHISRNNVNGGSIRFTIGHGNKRFLGAVEPVDWTAFRRDIEANKGRVVRFLERCHDRGLVVAGLAASTKFNTVLQYYGLGPRHIAAIGERNPDKVGLHTVTGIPIVSEEALRRMEPHYAVVGAWQFLESIQRREVAMLEHGTRLVTCIPRARVWVHGAMRQAA